MIAEDENTLPVTNETSPVVSESMTLSSPIETQTENLLLSSESVESEIANVIEDNSQTLPENEQTGELWEKTLLPEDTQSQAEFATLWQLEYSLPDSSDTITVLTDLVIDVSGDEEVQEVVSDQPKLEPQLIDNSQTTSVESESQVCS